MSEFVLIDLRSQITFLPRQMRTWPREHILGWLRIYGEVHPLGDPSKALNERLSPEHMRLFQDTYIFRSWVGLQTGVVIRGPGDLFIPGTPLRAWMAPEEEAHAPR
jgi:hypothetical protein